MIRRWRVWMARRAWLRAHLALCGAEAAGVGAAERTALDAAAVRWTRAVLGLLLLAGGCFEPTPMPDSEVAVSACAEQRAWLQIRDWPLTVEMSHHMSTEQAHAVVDAVQAWNEDAGAELFGAPRTATEASQKPGTAYIGFGLVKDGRIAQTRLYDDHSAITLPTAMRWSEVLAYDDLVYAIQHELGHALGLRMTQIRST